MVNEDAQGLMTVTKKPKFRSSRRHLKVKQESQYMQKFIKQMDTDLGGVNDSKDRGSATTQDGSDDVKIRISDQTSSLATPQSDYCCEKTMTREIVPKSILKLSTQRTNLQEAKTVDFKDGLPPFRTSRQSKDPFLPTMQR